MLRQIFSLPSDAPIIYFARHGHSLANEIIEKDLLLPEHERTLHYNFPYPDHKIPLTNTGKRQARALGRTLAKLFPANDPIDRILVSPFKRTRQTTSEGKRMLSKKPKTIIEPALAERSRGDLYGYSNKGLKLHFPGFLEQWQNPAHGMTLEWPNGMTAEAFIQLLQDFTHNSLINLPGITGVHSHSFAIVCMEVVLEEPNRSEALRIYNERRIPNCGLSIFARRSPEAPFTRLQTDGLF